MAKKPSQSANVEKIYQDAKKKMVKKRPLKPPKPAKKVGKR